ncbi:MAG: hypothetical protein LBU82_05080 [Treponema sp.]|nr:hypothetical protein [Treponema sp.]
MSADRVRLDVIADNGIGRGVCVAEIQVELPNVDVVTEMVDMISASRSYEANSSIIEGSKAIFRRALSIGSR